MGTPIQLPPELRGIGHLRHVAVHQQRFALLFFFLLFSIAVYPYAERGLLGYYVFRIVGGAGILLTVYAVTFRRSLFVLVLCLAVPAILQRIFVAPTDAGGVVLTSRLLSLLFDVIILTIIFRAVYSDAQPSSETIFGALSVYLLLGFTFASVYGLIVSLQPHALFLDPATNISPTPDRFDFIYFSFGTLTELGTPGITAVSREVRAMSLLEAVLGIFYLAVLISRIMSTYSSVSVTVQAPTGTSSPANPVVQQD